MEDKKESLRELYEQKYIYNEIDNSVLVAPQTPGSEVLSVLGFKKEGDIYPEFEDKEVTDIWWWLSSLVFEVSSNAKKITIVDPVFVYDRKTLAHIEQQRAERRMDIGNLLKQDVSTTIIEQRKKNKEKEQKVLEWIHQWQNHDFSNDQKIILNSSLAQDIQGIQDNSQDMVFFNFVLDKLQGGESKEKIILSALENAYRITKPWGKIYGVHNKGSSEYEIVDALNASEYDFDGKYKDRYIYFIIEKKIVSWTS